MVAGSGCSEYLQSQVLCNCKTHFTCKTGLGLGFKDVDWCRVQGPRFRGWGSVFKARGEALMDTDMAR